jgi:hypothetical protein
LRRSAFSAVARRVRTRLNTWRILFSLIDMKLLEEERAKKLSLDRIVRLKKGNVFEVWSSNISSMQNAA